MTLSCRNLLPPVFLKEATCRLVQFEIRESNFKYATRVWNQWLEFKIRESSLKYASRLWNTRVKFKTSESSLKYASQIWKTRVEFETCESSLKYASWVLNTRVELEVSGWGMKVAVGVGAPLGFRTRQRPYRGKLGTGGVTVYSLNVQCERACTEILIGVA